MSKSMFFFTGALIFVAPHIVQMGGLLLGVAYAAYGCYLIKKGE